MSWQKSWKIDGRLSSIIAHVPAAATDRAARQAGVSLDSAFRPASEPLTSPPVIYLFAVPFSAPRTKTALLGLLRFVCVFVVYSHLLLDTLCLCVTLGFVFNATIS